MIEFFVNLHFFPFFSLFKKQTGAVVIDCGISSIPDSTKKSGQRLVGDVDFDQVKEVASYITPGKYIFLMEKHS